MPYTPGWAFDPALPRIPEGEPECDRCGRRLTDLAAGGLLPERHRTPPLPPSRQCIRTRDDLLTIVWRLQRAAAGLDVPTNRWGFHWTEHRKLVALGTSQLSPA